jgi:MFS family permease
MDKFKTITAISAQRLAVASMMILCGLTLRMTGYETGLPYFLVKYGGSLIWGMMVFWIVGAMMFRLSIVFIATCAAAIAMLTEFSRLYHTPWLDAFRLTLAGALILGRIFSWGNILAYLLGIFLAAAIEWRLRRLRRLHSARN